MKKVIYLAIAILTACSYGGKVMTMESFGMISVGMTKDELIAQAGYPYAIHKLSPTEENYEYVERMNVEGRTIEERHYYFLIREGRVASKQVNTQTTPINEQRNSYDLQTSQNLMHESD